MSNLLRITNKIEALGIWDSIPSDSINSVVIEFEFAEDWKNLLCVAQFTQGEKTYNVVIENNRCVLPTELKIGNVMLSVFGTKTDGTPFRETSIPFCFEIYDAGFSSTAETPIPPTPDLYEQLIDKFSKDVVNSLNGKTGKVDIVADEGISVDDTETGKIKIKNTAKIAADPEMSDTSENPVQNKVVKKYVDEGHTVKLISSLNLDVAEQGLYYTDTIEYQGKVLVFSDFCFILYSKGLNDRKTVIVISSTGIEILNLLNMKTEPIYNYTIIDDVLSDISNNAIANKVVTQALLQQEIDLKNYADSLKTTIDAEMSETSENPVQNKVVKKYIDDKTENSERLLYDNTLTEPVSSVLISSDMDGNAFSVENITVYVTIPASPNLNALGYLAFQLTLDYKSQKTTLSTNITRIAGGTEGSYHRVMLKLTADDDRWNCISATTVNQKSSLYLLKANPDMMGFIGVYSKIPYYSAKGIYLGCSTAGSVLPIGTRIEVYAK